MFKDKNSKEIIKKGKRNSINVNTQKVSQKRLHYRCRFLDRQRHTSLLLISISAAT
jgi:hypothetical protein